jgi:hypothetical protein
MGFFSNLRAASTVGTAKQFVQKYLEVENVVGMVKASPKELAEKLVLAVWPICPNWRKGKRNALPSSLRQLLTRTASSTLMEQGTSRLRMRCSAASACSSSMT